MDTGASTGQSSSSAGTSFHTGYIPNVGDVKSHDDTSHTGSQTAATATTVIGARETSNSGNSNRASNASASTSSSSAPATSAAATTPTGNGNGNGNDASLADDADGDSEDHRGTDKRPRLRLAHACDRCRKRKIRCDTEQPCGPCKSTSSECTFNAPPRKPSKPRAAPNLTDSFLGGGSGRTRLASGFKRPHPGDGSIAEGTNGTGNSNSNEASASLEARLAALEAMLGNVPPKVHNMFLSSLDAKLGSGTLVKQEDNGIGLPLEAAGSGMNMNMSSGMSGGGGNWLGGGFGPDTTTGGYDEPCSEPPFHPLEWRWRWRWR